MLEDLAERREDEELLRSLGRAMLTAYEQDRDLHRMLMYAWLDQDEAANRRMSEQIRESPLFAFLERYVARRQAEGSFRAGDAALLSRALLALPVHYAVHTKLYGIGSDAPDEEVVALYARFLLAGLRGTDSDPAGRTRRGNLSYEFGGSFQAWYEPSVRSDGANSARCISARAQRRSLRFAATSA